MSRQAERQHSTRPASRKKPMIRARVLAFLVASVLGLSACAERPPLLEPVATIDGPYRLDTKDQLRVVVYEQPALTNLYEVNQAGNIAMPLIGDVAARGATTDEIEAKVKGRLAASYLRDPDVTVEVATYRPFFVLGEVNNPGQYVYVPKMTAETAIAAAGGYTERANRRVVRISRTLGGKLHEGRIQVTEPIRPGDTIYVYESLF
jgi:polysaccharide export outer membrane protein